MKNKYNGYNFAPHEGEKYLIDSNVWMYMYYIYGNYKNKKVSEYGKIVTNIMKCKATIIVPDIMVSELVNTYLRQEWKRYNLFAGVTTDYKKQYRKTPDFCNAMNEIKDIIENEIARIKNVEFMNRCYKITDFDSFFDASEDIDFNDKYYVEIAKEDNAYILTDDGDFDIDGVKIITCNNRLLSK